MKHLNGRVKFYSSDTMLVQSVAAMLMNLRDYSGCMRLPFDIMIVDNRINNHAIRQLNATRKGGLSPVIWLCFEPFYAYRATQTDYFVNARAPFNDVMLELSRVLYMVCAGIPAVLDPKVLRNRSLPRCERRALTCSLNEYGVHAQAEEYGLSPKTLYTQRCHASRKLGFQNFKQLVVWIISKERNVSDPVYMATIPARAENWQDYEREVMFVRKSYKTRSEMISGSEILIPDGGGRLFGKT